MIQRLLHKLCQRMDVSLLYHSAVGIKCLNQLIRSDHFKWFVQGGVFHVSGDQLRLGFDALKDEHTLLGTSVAESPHFELVRMLQAGEDIAASQYARRVAGGRLDFRPRRKPDATFPRKLKEDSDRTLAALRSGNMQPVTTIEVGGSHYIADGKHRAGVCAWAGQPCPCVDASRIIHDSFYEWVHRKMKRRATCYQKHIRWFESFIAVD
jgi:hypothetical protein